MTEEKSEEEALKKVIMEAAETFALIHKIIMETSAAYGELKSKEEARKGVMEAEEAYREMFKTHIDTLIAYGKLKGKRGSICSLGKRYFFG